MTFTSNSSEELSLGWTFEGANITNATGETVSNVTFSTEGTYNITLTGTDASIGYTETETIEVPVYTTSQILPDLTVSDQTANPNHFVSGTTVNITADIVNQGYNEANYVWVKYYISNDNIYDAGDTQIGQEYIAGPIEGGSSYPLSVNYTISSSAGSKYIIVYADRPETVTESNESNNYKAIPITVEPTMSDIIIQSFSATPNPTTSGENVTFSATIKNHYCPRKLKKTGYSHKDFTRCRKFVFEQINHDMDKNREIKFVGQPIFKQILKLLETVNIQGLINKHQSDRYCKAFNLVYIWLQCFSGY